jgi:hypothetical protein
MKTETMVAYITLVFLCPFFISLALLSCDLERIADPRFNPGNSLESADGVE